MFTVCPKCTLTLVVTTVDLRAGQGYVRCGRCANVFNALIALREGDPNGNISDTANRRLQETAPKPPAQPAVGAGVEMEPEPPPAPEAPPEPEPIPEPETPAAPEEHSLEFDAASTDVADIFISPSEAEHDTGSGNYEAVVLGEEAPAETAPEPDVVADDPSHTETIAADDWSLLDEEPSADAESVIEESPLAAGEETIDAEPAEPEPAWVEEMFAEAEAETQGHESEPEPAPEPEAEAEAPATDDVAEVARTSTGAAAPSDTALEPLLNEPVKQRPAWQYATGIGVLVLLLGIQAVHFNRQNLVLNNSWGPMVTRVYGWFGVTLMPRWDLTAYNVRLMSVDAEGGESSRLRVRLSVHNKSDRVQPLPLLRLTLLDRFSTPVATRDLEPDEYLSRNRTQRLLEPDQRIDTEVHVVDPGKAAEGYVIDACLKGEGGTVGCASDANRPAAG